MTLRCGIMKRCVKTLLIDRFRTYVPEPFPEPLDQPGDCDAGGDLVATFQDGSELSYGPCIAGLDRWPVGGHDLRVHAPRLFTEVSAADRRCSVGVGEGI